MKRPDQQKRILVTGGAGFLGSHLCERLLGLGHEVICADNLYTGNRHNIRHLLDDHRFEFLRHDITFPLYLEVDEIYNLACPASPIYYQQDPVQTTKTSVHGAINMLGLAKRTKARILQASTSEVYGDPQIHPQVEGYWGNVNPIGIRACYDEGKRCAETLFFDYHRQHGLEIKVARIFNTYGPRMHPTTAAWCPISCCRLSATSPSPSTAPAPRPAPSAMWTTSSKASSASWTPPPTSPAP
jgi:UDP-glucuronate decarboxylase